MRNPNETQGKEMRVESVVEQNIAAMVNELTNRASTTLIERQGNDLVIKMTNGEEVVVESFFIAFTETQFHQMQAGVYGNEEVVDVVEVAEVPEDTGVDEPEDAIDSSTSSGGIAGIGGILAAGAGIALVGGAAGGGSSGGSGPAEEEEEIVDETIAAAMMDLEDGQSDEAQMTQEEFAALIDAADEAGSNPEEETTEASTEEVAENSTVLGQVDDDLAMAQLDMAPSDTAWDDLSQQVDVI
ncbi:BapA prefix-like domain-containing protein [Pseudosulfitobacter pseudonitzschiae]|uniref:BapA prefix-like domain-containing protein n=1 Tax=Pseudosulfitobacter pseudonitzschiae TaxID=1402135 RepID=UPI003B7E22DE